MIEEYDLRSDDENNVDKEFEELIEEIRKADRKKVKKIGIERV